MDWAFRKGTDYFDNREQNNIWVYSQEYDILPADEKVLVDQTIRGSLESWLDFISQEQPEMIENIGAIILDDIYRSGNLMYRYNDGVANYLHATAKPAMDWYKRHNIMIHYMCNNTFSEYIRPLIIFPRMLATSGIVYICPHHIAWTKMESMGIEFENYEQHYKEFETEAFEQSQKLIERCCELGCHYMHLDIDAGEKSFDKAISYQGQPGHIIAFREEAPQDSAKIRLF